MQIVCPSCSTAYEVPDSVFSGGARKLRCEHCATQWRAGPAGNEPAEPPPAAPSWTDNAPPPADDFAAPSLPPNGVPRFGKAVDEVADSEFRQALDRENVVQPAADQRYPTTPVPDADDPFISLVMAARSGAIQFEPELPSAPKLSFTSPLVLGGVGAVLVLVLALLFIIRH